MEMQIWKIETEKCDGNQILEKICSCEDGYAKLFFLAVKSRERKMEQARIASGYHEYSTNVVLWDPSQGDFMESDHVNPWDRPSYLFTKTQA